VHPPTRPPPPLPAAGWGPDGSPDAINGVYLRKSIPVVAARAMELCLRQASTYYCGETCSLS